jgi:agmatinase
VEVAPAYDGRGEETALAGAQVVYEILTSVVKRGLRDMGKVAEVEKLDTDVRKKGGGKGKDEL